MRTLYDLNARGTLIKLGHETRIMGIVNASPDSFSGDGQTNRAACLRHALRLAREGADVIDIGGESTRPGASQVPLSLELKRVIPVVQALAKRSKIPISVDTSKPEVAKAALDAGACIINNIKGTRLNRSFLKMVRDYEAALVIMHMRGTPATMQSKARYKDVTAEVIAELKISVEKCLAIGIKKDRIMIDCGIGFAKNLNHNLILIKHLERLKVLGCPILLGTSRKSFIGKLLQKEETSRLMGTAAAVTAGVMQGAHMVRVHDVKAIKETVKVTDAILNAH